MKRPSGVKEVGNLQRAQYVPQQVKSVKTATDPYSKAMRSKQKNKTENISLNKSSCRLVENGRSTITLRHNRNHNFFFNFFFCLFVCFFVFSFFRRGERGLGRLRDLYLFLYFKKVRLGGVGNAAPEVKKPSRNTRRAIKIFNRSQNLNECSLVRAPQIFAVARKLAFLSVLLE